MINAHCNDQDPVRNKVSFYLKNSLKELTRSDMKLKHKNIKKEWNVLCLTRTQQKINCSFSTKKCSWKTVMIWPIPLQLFTYITTNVLQLF